MDVSQYLEIFIDETKEHLQNLNEQLLILEKEPDNEDTINEIFRAAHSLKGMAGTMGFKRMQRLTHDTENVFSEIRNGKMKANAELVDVLFRSLDALEGYLANILETGDEGDNDHEDIINQLNTILKNGTGGGTAPAETAPAASAAPTGAAPAGTATAGTAPTGAAPANASPEAAGGMTDEQLKNIPLHDYEIRAIAKGIDNGDNAYSINVSVQETCLLKAARAFLVFKAIEELGTVIKSVPSIQDIEDEKFENDFQIVIITKESIDKVRTAITNVSEIKSAQIVKLEKRSEDSAVPDATDTTAHAATPETPAETAPAATPAAAQQQSTQTTASKENSSPAKTGTQTSSKPVVNRSVRVDIEKLDDLMNLVSELIIAKNGLVAININDSTKQLGSGFNEQIEYLERITTNLHQSVMKVRMVPIESVVNRFPRLIRDLSKKLDKRMELYMSGEDTELDRTVIDEIGDPLMHLLRNAADHGLETNEERAKTDKNPTGSIFLNAYQDGNNVVIEVKDDGRGINVEKIKEKALSRGNISREQAETMTDKEAIDLLFRPSFSTAEKISDVSGRGVGLDVVKTKIESLGGDVEVKSVLGQGSSFIIRLPLTLAIIQALMVELGTEKYAIPLGSIQTIEDVPVSDIKYVQTKEVIHLRGSVIPIIRLGEMLDIESTKEKTENLTVVIVSKGDKLAGLVVDNLIGQQEIVIKSIGKYISTFKMISGATILGDGEVALILDVNTLV